MSKALPFLTGGVEIVWTQAVATANFSMPRLSFMMRVAMWLLPDLSMRRAEDHCLLNHLIHRLHSLLIRSASKQPQESLHMLEFQIYSTSGSNVAPQGTASQSSTWGNLAAAKAIDSFNSTFSHTTNLNAWWEVQLNEAEGVEELVILNSYCQGYADSLGCLCRLSEARITLYNNNVSVATRQLGNTCGELVVSESFSSQLFTIY